MASEHPRAALLVNTPGEERLCAECGHLPSLHRLAPSTVHALAIADALDQPWPCVAPGCPCPDYQPPLKGDERPVNTTPTPVTDRQVLAVVGIIIISIGAAFVTSWPAAIVTAGALLVALAVTWNKLD